MRVAVGSGNPVKYAATVGAFGDLASSIDRVTVESGVSEQPRSTAETIEGAKNRARRALAAGDYDLGVGIEGGVATIDGLDGKFLTMWAAIDDGSGHSLGSGPRLRLPDSIATDIERGAELGPLLDELLGTDGIKEESGAVGVFTENTIGREDALRHAVAVALGPIISEHYD
ncbi:MAG: inosine/xanthosine triphosphatase [Halodesulfurarchaeum sp.]|nr:inosine/xanthosine triphosphatase [Halodesulfurarchaeum sp.]